MRPLFADEAVQEAPRERTAQEILAEQALLAQAEVDRLTAELKAATDRRNQLVRQVYLEGVKTYSGYRFIEKKAPSSVSEKLFREVHPDAWKAYCEYSRETSEVKVSRTAVLTFLKVTGDTDPAAFLASITEEGVGEPSYQMQKQKEVAE